MPTDATTATPAANGAHRPPPLLRRLSADEIAAARRRALRLRHLSDDLEQAATAGCPQRLASVLKALADQGRGAMVGLVELGGRP